MAHAAVRHITASISSRSLHLVLAILLAPIVARGQAPADDSEKLSNDRPDRPLQMPAASSETKEAFEDFDRFVKRGAWERATKALYAIPENQALRFVDGADGFIIPVARKRRAVLAGMSPEGQAAYRLFYDADAKKLFDQAEGATEQATLERLFSAYFLTSIGDNAADRLGDLYFEQAQFDRAADCWLAILRERTDSEIPPALLSLKAATALKKAGRTSELEAIRGEINERFPDETVSLGGRTEKAPKLLRDLVGETAPSEKSAATRASGPPLHLMEPLAPTWQVRFGDSVKAGMTPLESQQWEANALSGAVPPVAISGTTLFVNYLDHLFAVDLATGKMLWRSQSFHNVEISAMQTQMVDPKRFSILAAPGFVWSVGRDLRDQNYMATFSMTCRRGQNGEVVWKSADINEYANMDLVGLPILANDVLFMTGKSSANNGQDNQPHQFVLAIRPHDGKILWKTDVGTFREAQQQYYYYAMMTPTAQPRLTYRAGSIYLDTHVGVLAKLDAESGALDWGLGYPTEPVQTQNRFFFFGNMPTAAAVPLSTIPFQAGDAFLVKGAKSDHLLAIDPDRMKQLWDRPIAKSARILGADDKNIYLGGPDLGALDRQSRVLRWSTPLPGGSEDGAALVRPDGLWQLTSRGIFEVDPASGRIRKIFRGDDPGATGGDLLLTDRWLLSVSNRTISAYARVASDQVANPVLNTETRGSDD